MPSVSVHSQPEAQRNTPVKAASSGCYDNNSNVSVTERFCDPHLEKSIEIWQSFRKREKLSEDEPLPPDARELTPAQRWLERNEGEVKAFDEYNTHPLEDKGSDSGYHDNRSEFSVTGPSSDPRLEQNIELWKMFRKTERNEDDPLPLERREMSPAQRLLEKHEGEVKAFDEYNSFIHHLFSVL
ncbi:hypothetical protein QFC19_005129 [Naganishia cerealis]|uniref:Uncharacterized protein n=1 Tax=Naganishia cerealis TaxID=610337 RepID=A0ACC2VQT9_9TREE|nr:hypothetical protein QFC19_005129 [Naganishia cerealis]